MPYRRNVKKVRNRGPRRWIRYNRYKKRHGFKYASQNRAIQRVTRPMSSGIQYMKFRTSFNLEKSLFTNGTDNSLYYLMRFCPLKLTIPAYIDKLNLMKNFYAWYKPVKTSVKFSRPKVPLNTDEESAVLSRLQIRGGTQMLHPTVVYVSDGSASDSMTQQLLPYSEAIYPTTWKAAVDNTSDRFKLHGYGGGQRTWLPATQFEKRWSQFTSSDGDHSYGTLMFMIQENAYIASTSSDGSEITVIDLPDDFVLFEGTVEYTIAFRTRL